MTVHLSTTGRALIYTVAITLFFLLAFSNGLTRSVWIDEAMLFNNYPLDTVSSLFSPLPYYDQAAPPLYSLIGSTLAHQPIATIRSAFFALSLATIAFLLLRETPTILAAILVAAIIALYTTPLVLFSELKHYGFEILGSFIIFHWFVSKDSDADFGARDAAIVAFAMALGITTLVLAAVATVLFFFLKLAALRNYKGSELAWLGVLLSLFLVYYLVIKNITEIQITNYIDAYTDLGWRHNVRRFVLGASNTLRATHILYSLIILGTITLLVLTISDFRSRRIIALGSLIAISFVGLAAFGYYPAGNTRHLAWILGIFYVALFYSVLLAAQSKGTVRILAIVFSSFMIGTASLNFYRASQFHHEITDNNTAIELLASMPSSDVGVWIGGQPVIQFYKKHRNDLSHHRYFALINPESKKIEWDGLKSNTPESTQLDLIPDAAGAWGQMVMLRMQEDYSQLANHLLNTAPKNRTFIILASHFNPDAKSGFSAARARALYQGMAEAKCSFEIRERVRDVVLYEAWCPNSVSQLGG